MSLQRFITYINTHNRTEFNTATATVAELQAVADLLAPFLRSSTILASGLSGVSLLNHVSMIEGAREDLQRLGIHIDQ